ncbi:MAG: hypothetical protein Q8L21_00085, partial [Candidatus Komeilibacteria bacterium]|nr:hypothetical protein [Candidatus Komeilibacteria bacterium]
QRTVLIIAVATILAALLIVIVFIFLINRQADSVKSDTNEFLQNIQKQRDTSQPGANQDIEEAEIINTVIGVLTGILPDTLEITEKSTSNKITIGLTADTVIMYNGQNFDRSRLYIGDQLEIKTKKEGTAWRARQITVLVSASPETPAAMPQITPQNIRPDGSVKPL